MTDRPTVPAGTRIAVLVLAVVTVVGAAGPAVAAPAPAGAAPATTVGNADGEAVAATPDATGPPTGSGTPSVDPGNESKDNASSTATRGAGTAASSDGPRRTVPVGSVPAAPVVHELEQPNGLTFRAEQWGDAWSHGWQTLAGYTIVRDDRGYWTYATVRNGELVATDRRVGVDPVPRGLSKGVRPADDDAPPRLRRSSADPSAVAPQAAPTQGDVAFPVVLINFNNTNTSYPPSDFQSLIFGEDPAIATGPGSVHDFYENASYGQLNLTGEVYGWVEANNSHDYYGEGGVGDGLTDFDTPELIEEAARKMDDTVDFSQYDNNGDGVVDQFIVIHQGGGQEVTGNSGDIWSHKYSIYYETNDGVTIEGYTVQPETLYGELTTVGVLTHEMGHAFGLPDLYDTDYSSDGIGAWGLMASGSYNSVNRVGDSPAQLSSWSRRFLGWNDPTVVGLNESHPDVELRPSAKYDDHYQVLDPNVSREEQYFLVENRQHVGFDRGLPGEGVLVWDVNRSKITVDSCLSSNTCNDDESNKLVDLEAADGDADLDNGNGTDAEDAWTGGRFDPDSVPSSNYDDGLESGIKVGTVDVQGDVAHLSVSAVPSLLGSQWSLDTGGRTQFAAAAVSGDRVVLGGLDATVFGVYRRNGTVDWTFERNGSLADSSPTVAGGTVFVGDGGGTVWALDVADGSPRWHVDTDSAVVSSPRVAGGTVYVGSNDGTVLALNATTGAVEWSVETGAPVLSRPAVGSGTVSVTTDDGRLIGLDASGGSQQWSFDTGTELGHASPALSGGTVYVAADQLYAVNASDGTVRWRTDYGGYAGSTPTLEGGTLYVGAENGSVTAFDGGTGTVVWTADVGAPVRSSPAVVGDRVVVTGNDGNVTVLNATTGSRVGSVTPWAQSLATATVADDEVYVGGGNGTVQAFANVDRDYGLAATSGSDTAGATGPDDGSTADGGARDGVTDDGGAEDGATDDGGAEGGDESGGLDTTPDPVEPPAPVEPPSPVRPPTTPNATPGAPPGATNATAGAAGTAPTGPAAVAAPVHGSDPLVAPTPVGEPTPAVPR